jgi:hypothetical protein
VHVALAWNIIASGSRWNEINDKLEAVIKTHSWVRSFPSLYVVKVSSTEERDELVVKLTEIAKSVPEKVNFIITPVMTGGRYNGFLPKDLWDKINDRTG